MPRKVHPAERSVSPAAPCPRRAEAAAADGSAGSAPTLDTVTTTLMRWIGLSMRRAQGGVGSMQHLSEQGFTFSSVSALHVLAFDGAQTMTAISERLGLSTSAASTLIQKLVDAGYVVRTESASDRRQRVLSLSDDGQQIMRSLMAERFREMRLSLEPLSAPTLARLQAVMVDIIAELEQRAGAPTTRTPPSDPKAGAHHLSEPAPTTRPPSRRLRRHKEPS